MLRAQQRLSSMPQPPPTQNPAEEAHCGKDGVLLVGWLLDDDDDGVGVGVGVGVDDDGAWVGRAGRQRRSSWRPTGQPPSRTPRSCSTSSQVGCLVCTHRLLPEIWC
eukprot:1365704-Rhodomonas_salina.3